MKILIVDDAKENLFALKSLLDIENVEVIQARSGMEALDLLIKHDICLALLDVQMPDMDGFELAKYMRGTKRTRNIPIIFVTGEIKDQRFYFEGHELAPVSFIRKPLDTLAVKSQVRAFLQLHGQNQR